MRVEVDSGTPPTREQRDTWEHVQPLLYYCAYCRQELFPSSKFWITRDEAHIVAQQAHECLGALLTRP